MPGKPIPNRSSDVSTVAAGAPASGLARLTVWVLAVLATLFLVWPVWRATLGLEIWGNEGWNAYHADEALSLRALYPPPDGLVANNYPPLSFLLIEGLGRVFGDPLLVGRALSLIATLALGLIAYPIARQFGASRAAAAVGGLWFVATMARFFDFYVGMNEPQLLAQAIMCAGLAWLLARQAAGKAVEPAILVMVLAGFFKHNLVAFPLIALIWLALEDRRLALRATVTGAIAAMAGLLVCYAVYGPDFIADMQMPRTYHLDRALNATGRLQFIAPALVLWAIWAWAKRHTKAARFTTLFIAVTLVTYLVQKSGAGVDENAQFDLVFATAVGIGIAFDRLPLDPLRSGWSPQRIRLLILAVLAVRLIASTRLEFAYVLLSADYRALAAEHVAVARAEAARVAAMPGPIACSNLVVCRMAGKPFVYDAFLVSQLLEAGKASAADIAAKLHAKGIVIGPIDERAKASSLYRRYRTD
jgi:hypothetical protein